MSFIIVDVTKLFQHLQRLAAFFRNLYHLLCIIVLIDNTNIKTGTKYYYRVRGYVLFNGEKVYTDWSLKAFRAVGK